MPTPTPEPGANLRGTDVGAMMTRVNATLAAAERSPDGAAGVLPVAPEGDSEVNVAVLRKSADIRLDFPPGSARPVVGSVVRLGKRALRRAVRWYVWPMMEQQSRFNHALLDGIERLRVRIEHGSRQPATAAEVAGTLPAFAAGRAVAVGPGAQALADLVCGDTGTRPETLADDPVEQLGALDAQSVTVVVCNVTGLGPKPVITALEAAHATLVPGGVIILSADDDPESLRPAALEWALSATGFVEVATPTMPPDVTGSGEGAGDLAEQLARLDAVARAAGVVLVARRGR